MRLSAFLVSLLIFSNMAIAQPGKISVEEAYSRSLANEVLLIDIRTPQEWRQSGAPASAYLLDMRSKSFVRELQVLMASHPEKPIALICATGGRSGYLSKRLEEFGVSGVIDVSEGMFGSAYGPGWLKRGLPVRQVDDPQMLDRPIQQNN